MKAKECIFAWNPNSNQVEVGPWPDNQRWSSKYQMTGGASNALVRNLPHKELVGYLFIEAMKIIIRDKVDPFSVHNAFCNIDEYLEGLSEDTPVPV